jgi:gluconokinase
VEQALTEVTIEVRKRNSRIDRVCISGAMHSILAVDANGKPLTNAVIWADSRADKQADELNAKTATLGRDIYQRTGTPIHPMIPLCKLAWFRKHKPQLLARAAKLISLKEYVWWKLTGNYQIDYSIATATGLFDGQRRTWYKPALDFAGIRADQLAELQPTTYVTAYEPDRKGVTKTTLPAGTQLYIGASDGCLANLGAGCIEPGITTITIGTSGAVRRTVNKALRDPNGRLFCYFLDERSEQEQAKPRPYYVVGGPSNNGGNVLQWLAEKLVQRETEAVLTTGKTVQAGSDGLLFLPYLNGERAPIWDASARGAYLNVDYRHTQAHFIRAALEGVLFNLLTIEKMLAKLTGPSRMIYANGGFAQSAFWVQMMADVFGVPVRLNASNDSSAMGAILLASDTNVSLETLANEVIFGATFEPNAEQHNVYREVFSRWEQAVKQRV